MREKRCGSSISSSAQKLSRYPLCGVAERNRRCSKCGAISRIVCVLSVGFAHFPFPAGAAWCASSTISRSNRRRSSTGFDGRSRVSCRSTSGRRSHWSETIIRGWVPNSGALGPDRAPELLHRRAVGDEELEAEAVEHLVVPLLLEVGGADDEHRSRPVAEQQLLDDEARLDRLPDPDLVGDQQVDARHLEGAHDRLELVVGDLDARPERRLQRPRVRGGDRAPADRVDERVEPLRVVEPLRGERRQRRLRQHLGARLDLPDDGELVAEAVVLDRGGDDEVLGLDVAVGVQVERLRAR